MPSRKLLALSVYVSSPGDVDSERRIAIGKLLSLQRRGAFAGKLTVTIKAWDDQEDPVPMVATEEAQETVNTFKGKPEECDLTIVILWSRLGSSTVVDGREHASGTAWEFDNAARAAKPVWVYCRTQTPLVPLGDEASLLEANRQYRALKDFLGNLRTPHGKSVHINKYADDDAFERHLGAVLEGWARRRLDAAVDGHEDEEAGRPARAAQPSDYDDLRAVVGQLTSIVQELSARLPQVINPSDQAHAPASRAATPVEAPESASTLPAAAATGIWSRLAERFASLAPAEVLRETLASWSAQESVALDTEDETFAGLNAWAPADVDVLVAGHSLAPRSHPRGDGSARYLNTGCWAPVLCLSPETLQDRTAFASVFDALTGRDSLQKIWTKRATVASIVQAGPVTAGLCSVELDGSLLRVVDAVLPEVPNPSRANANLDVPIPAFQEVRVVSDLLMSATAETGETARRLAALMDGMASCPACRTCVVLNGNTFDFRSEQPASYLEPASAAEVVRRAVLAGDGAPFWDSLRRFLRQPDSHLAIVLGDREVELAMPAARHWLVEWLAPDPAVRARVFTAFDGLGFECSVGGRRVLCLHGHEADAWNGVDQAQLLNLVRANRRRDKIPNWEPSVGVRLLVDVVGPMRARYPFLAGLGPMRSHLVPVLVALNPGLMRPIGTLLARQAGRLDQGRL